MIVSEISLRPIGYLKTSVTEVPRHWRVSDAEGEIVVEERYRSGLRDIRAGDKIIVVFHFHRSPAFSDEYLIQHPPRRDEDRGVFSTCSPIRPNPLGFSLVEVIEVQGNRMRVKGIDMLDGTPVLDIKPWHED